MVQSFRFCQGSGRFRYPYASPAARHTEKGGTILEATSGNMGIALAALAAQEGYSCVIAMPEDVSQKRIALLRSYGAQVILTPASEAMPGAVSRVRELAASTPDSFYVNQFANPANPLAHYCTTGPEIWAQTGGKIDCFLAGVGTGGTLTGTARYLKERNPGIHIAAVLPAAGTAIPGLGAGFLPAVLETSLIDEWIHVHCADALQAVRDLSQVGIPVGTSSGAAFHAVRCLALRQRFSRGTIVTLFADDGSRDPDLK